MDDANTALRDAPARHSPEDRTQSPADEPTKPPETRPPEAGPTDGRTLDDATPERTPRDPATPPPVWQRLLRPRRRSRSRAPELDPATRAGLRQTAKRLLGYARVQRTSLITAVVLFFASSAIDPLVPALFKWLIDNGLHLAQGPVLWLLPIAIIGLFLVRGLLAFGGNYLFARGTSSAVLVLRKHMMSSVMGADAQLYTQLSPGVTAARVIADPNNAIGALAGALTTLLRDGTTLVALLGYLFWLNWQLTLISFVTIPLLALVVRRVQRRVLLVSGHSWESQVRLIGIVEDVARAWRVVRSFGAADFERRRFDAEAERLRSTTLKSIVAGAMMTPLTQVIASCGVALIITLALIESHRSGGTVGDFVAFITTLLMTISPMRHLTDVTQPIAGGLVQARACFDLIDVKPESDLGTIDVGQARGAVSFEQASVAYGGAERPAVCDVSMELPAGGTVACVGPSGCGKSTLINTMLAFVEVSAGRVTLDGVDIRQIKKESLRRQFAVVSQDIALFDDSIEANIVYAAEPDPARLEACIAAAGLQEFVASLPDGTATCIGTDGGRLSGGQRQRLAIARALYKDAPIWVFDEATSALDSASEQFVQDSIRRWRGARTLVIVAHRLSTVRNADRIYVMAGGRIAESGSHDELMRLGGAYTNMVRAQAVG